MNTFTADQAMWQTAISGTVTNRDLLDLERRLDALSEDVSLAPCGLVDLRGAIELDIDFPTLNRTLDAVARRRRQNRVRTAILVDGPAQYSLARMIGLLRNQRQVAIRIFEDEEEALKWVLNWPWCPLYSPLDNEDAHSSDRTKVVKRDEVEVDRGTYGHSDRTVSVT